MSECYFSTDISERLSCCKDGKFDRYGFPNNLCNQYPCAKYKLLTDPKSVPSMIKPEDFEPVWGYKYVRFSDGVILFCDAVHCSHKQLAEEYGGSAISAGTIKVRYKKWGFESGGSVTLKIGSLKDDVDALEKALSGYEYDSDMGW